MILLEEMIANLECLNMKELLELKHQIRKKIANVAIQNTIDLEEWSMEKLDRMSLKESIHNSKRYDNEKDSRDIELSFIDRESNFRSFQSPTIEEDSDHDFQYS